MRSLAVDGMECEMNISEWFTVGKPT